MSENGESSTLGVPDGSEPPAGGDDEVKSLLRGALAHGEGTPDLVRGIQRRIRVRSKGKFYADGWSTARHPPLNTYLITSLMMLAIVGVIYSLLHPLSGEPAPPEPLKPVQVLPAPAPP